MGVEYRSLPDSAILVQTEDGKSGEKWQLVNPELASKDSSILGRMIADVSLSERFCNMASHLHHQCADLSLYALYRHLLLVSRDAERRD